MRLYGVSTYSSGQEGQHLIDKFTIREISTLHDGTQDIRIQFLTAGLPLLQSNLLFLDRFLAELAEEAHFGLDDFVQSPWNPLHQPLGQGAVHGHKCQLLPAGLQYGQEAIGNLVLGMRQRLEVKTHGSWADDIEGKATI